MNERSINSLSFSPQDIILRCDATEDDIIDLIEGNRVYIPAIYVLNKIDQISIEELDVIYKIPHCVPISAHHKWNFDDLLEKLWSYLKLVRIYTKPKGQLPDYSAPVVLTQGKSTVEDFCNKIHRAIIQDFKYALVWVREFDQNQRMTMIIAFPSGCFSETSATKSGKRTCAVSDSFVLTSLHLMTFRLGSMKTSSKS